MTNRRTERDRERVEGTPPIRCDPFASTRRTVAVIRALHAGVGANMVLASAATAHNSADFTPRLRRVDDAKPDVIRDESA